MFSRSSGEVKEKFRNSSWLMEGIRGSSIGVRVGFSWVKSGSKLFTSSGVFCEGIKNDAMFKQTRVIKCNINWESQWWPPPLWYPLKGLTILGLNGGSSSLRFSFSQSMPLKKGWSTMAVSPPSEATQPRRRAGFLVSNCREPKVEFITTKSKTCDKHIEKKQ